MLALNFVPAPRIHTSCFLHTLFIEQPRLFARSARRPKRLFCKYRLSIAALRNQMIRGKLGPACNPGFTCNGAPRVPMRHYAFSGPERNDLKGEIHSRPPFGKPVIRHCTSEAETTPPRLYVSTSAQVAVSAKKHGGRSRGEVSTSSDLGSACLRRFDSQLCGRDAFGVANPASGFASGGDPVILVNSATTRTAS